MLQTIVVVHHISQSLNSGLTRFQRADDREANQWRDSIGDLHDNKRQHPSRRPHNLTRDFKRRWILPSKTSQDSTSASHPRH